MDFDEAIIDTLKDSLSDKEEKEEFLELIFAAISPSSSEPAAGETKTCFFVSTRLLALQQLAVRKKEHSRHVNDPCDLSQVFRGLLCAGVVAVETV